MMIANRFRAVGWVAGVAAAALSCYLISLQVAAERGKLMKLERNILTAHADIRQLQTELNTRGRLVQLERWNADVLGLQAPKASQYARGEVQLAGYMQPKPVPQVIPVAVQVPAAAAPPPVVAAAYKAPTPSLSAPPHVEPQPMMRHATYVAPAPAVKLAQIVPAAVRGTAAPAATPSLLGDDLLGEIGHRAAAEAKKK